MQILTIDIGTGTQDIYLYDSRLDLENGLKLVVPSPTMIVHRQINTAARQGAPILLSGEMMGGGPSGWAAEAHARLGLGTYATPSAARTLNDDLEAVRALGIQIVSADEAARLPERVQRITLRDFDFPAVAAALGQFGVSLEHLAAVAVAVFDHGNSPPGYSDRQFRFDYLDQRLRSHNRLSAFAYLSTEIPPIMTRLQSVAVSAQQAADPRLEGVPLVVMDTAPAAVLGATFDPLVGERQHVLVANVGNFHTLAFRLGAAGIEGVFEHHTGLINRVQLEELLLALADGTLQHAEVFENHGHGALVYNQEPLPIGLPTDGYDVAVTGPRRSLLAGAQALRPYFAVPFGDMMIAGCFGLLAAVADLLPELAEPIRASLVRQSGSATEYSQRAPWDFD